MKHTPEEIKNRLSNIGEAIGGIALEYIAELEKENKELHVTNKSLLESCEGATMMYKDLCKAKEIINELVDDYIAIGYASVDSKLIDKATDFIKR